MAKEARPALEERMAKVEGTLEQMSERLNHIEARLNLVEGKLSQIVWMIFGMWVTVTLTILATLLAILFKR